MSEEHPYYECKSFDSCSCNVCPLDPESWERNKLSNDDKCKCWKPTRKAIGEKYSKVLRYKGLTKREWTSKKSWDDKPQAEKENILRALAKQRKTLQNRQEGVLNG